MAIRHGYIDSPSFDWRRPRAHDFMAAVRTDPRTQMPDHDRTYIGQAHRNRRTATLLAGQGLFTDDVSLPGALHLAFLRSPVASGRIDTLDLAAARAVAGVHAVHVGADVAMVGVPEVNAVLPLLHPEEFPVLALDNVHAAGQPVAAALAESRAVALDACEAIGLEVTATEVSPREIARKSWRSGDAEAAFATAPLVVQAHVAHPRLAPSPLEPRAIAVEYLPATDGVTVWLSTQTPHRARSQLARILGRGEDAIHVIAPDVGGAFGMKASLYPEEVFAVWAAFHHRRSVRWTATRSEDFLSATHGRGLTCGGRLALAEDGQFLALEAEVEAPLGHWLPNSALVPAWNAARILPGAYDIAHVSISTSAVAHALAPTGIYRGAGRPEANCLMERLVDDAARATGIDPIELRKRNLVIERALPFRTVTGNLLDSGDYAGLLDRLTTLGAYSTALATRDARRAEGGLAGLGVAFYLEPSGSGWESARVTWGADGQVTVTSGSSSQGHGRDTAFAQIAAETLDLPIERVEVICGDTALCPPGIGALASRSTAIGGSAVFRACEELRARSLRGDPLPMVAEVRYENEGQAWGYGAYLVAVEIDAETGRMEITEATCVDDAGRIVNPAQVEGQIRGGFAQGWGEAMCEAIRYDGDGQLLTGSLMDYALPRAADLPPLSIHKTETPSPMNALGAKGVGEAGTIGAPAAILNAALDALAPLGVRHLDMPLTPDRIWQAITDARGD